MDKQIEAIEAIREELRQGPFPKNRVFDDAAIQCLGDACAHLKQAQAQRGKDDDEAKARVEEARRIVAEADAAK